MGARSVLIVAELTESERAAIEQDCESCNFDVTWLSSADLLGSTLVGGKFDTLVVHLQTPGAARACVEARTALSRVRFPIMALTDAVDDATYNKAFRVGADDVVDFARSAQISQRLAAIPKASWKPVSRSRGEALIVDPDKARADALARLLKEAGFLVKSVRDAPTAKLHLGRQSVRLVVCDDTTLKLAPLVKDGNRREWRPAWVVRARPTDIDRLSAELATFRNAAVVNIYLSANDVLHEANRIATEHSSAPRYLYGTTVDFSTPQSDWKEQGFCYAIDDRTLVVRTLALPPARELHLELVAPGTEQRVRLEGELSERRVFGPLETQVAPPGFSVELTAGDLTAWREAYQNAYRKRFGQDAPERPTSTQSAGEPNEARAVGRVQLASASSSNEGRPRAATLKSAPLQADAEPEPTSQAPGTKPGLAPPPAPVREVETSALGAKQQQPAAPLAQPQRKSPRTRLGLGLAYQAPVDDADKSMTGANESPGDSTAAASIASESTLDSLVNPSADVPKAGNDKDEGPSPAAATAGVTGRSTLVSASERRADKDETGPDAEHAAELGTATEAPSSEENQLASSDATASSVPKSASASEPGAVTDDKPLDKVVTAGAQDRQLGSPGSATTSATPPSDQRQKKGKPGKTLATSKRSQQREDARSVASEAAKPKGSGALLIVLGVLAAGAVAAFLTAQPSTSRKQGLQAQAPTQSPPNIDTAKATAPAVATATRAPTATAIAGSAAPTTAGPSDAEHSAHATSDDSQDQTPAARAAPNKPPASQLPRHLGYLFVASSLDTQVFVQGKLAGKTNRYLKSFCGTRYVRLGSEPGHWQSAGVTMKIKCQALNRIQIEQD